MKKFGTLLAVGAALLGAAATADAQQLAFPTAEGYGASTPGGRGGKVFIVTNLDDSGPGSLREAIETDEPRTVVFEVAGTIELQKPLNIDHPYITIAGQTAPGQGITLKNYPLDIKGTHDVIVRSIRVRPGIGSGLEGSQLDGIEISGSQNVIVDHCNVSWSCDEGFNTWKGNKNITVQWCMMGEPLNKSVHLKGEHGYSASLGGENASFHHNLFASGKGRNPSIGGNANFHTINTDFRNNVVFNYGMRTCDGKPVSINVVNNYYKPGPATEPVVARRIARIDNASRYGFQGKWHVEGNVIENQPDLTADNWNGGVEIDDGLTAAQVKAEQPFATAPVKTQPAAEAYKMVLKNVGVPASKRDAQDKRILKEAKTGKPTYGNGIINSVEEVGGYPVLKGGKAPLDTDRDGMPDTWEKKNGLNPNDPKDGNAVASNGYTNLENYINSLMPVEK